MSSYLFTFERPVKTESGEMYKNAKAWDVKNGEIVGGWYQKTMEDWCVYYTINDGMCCVGADVRTGNLSSLPMRPTFSVLALLILPSSLLHLPLVLQLA